MKFLKNSFALVIALITVAVTMISNKSVTGKIAEWETARCFTDPITVKYRCVSSTDVINSSSTCTYASDFANGAHIFNINPNNYIEEENIAVECSGQDSFCCAQVLTDQTWYGNLEAPCVGQPYFTLDGINSQFEIAQVYCKVD